MAAAGPRDELNCCICLEIFTNPVNLACGHNYCRACIDRVLDTQEETGVYTCPECRLRFYGRPELHRNIALCNIVEHFRNAQPETPWTGISCTYCIHAPRPAVKSCVLCEASLCEDHLRVHSKSSEHVFSEPTTALAIRKCLVHQKTLEYYCTEDGTLICVSCRLDGDHKGHQVEMLDEASDKKKKKLRHLLEKLISKRDEDLRGGVQDNARVFDLIQQLEIKKVELSMRIQHIEQLCIVTDPLTLLLDQESDREDFYRIEVEEESQVDREIYGEGDGNRTKAIPRLFRSISTDSGILLDINTAANNVRVSSDLKVASWSPVYQRRPETDKRFQSNQVISTMRFSSGQYSWDVETSVHGDWRLGVAYPSIDRRGQQSYIGDNKKSWCLRKLYSNQYSVIHDSNVRMTPHRFTSHRFRVYVDYEAGQLSFYELCDPIKHLHTFSTTFTEPLHAAFGVGYWLCSEHCCLKIMDQGTI